MNDNQQHSLFMDHSQFRSVWQEAIEVGLREQRIEYLTYAQACEDAGSAFNGYVRQLQNLKLKFISDYYGMKECQISKVSTLPSHEVDYGYTLIFDNLVAMTEFRLKFA